MAARCTACTAGAWRRASWKTTRCRGRSCSSWPRRWSARLPPLPRALAVAGRAGLGRCRRSAVPLVLCVRTTSALQRTRPALLLRMPNGCGARRWLPEGALGRPEAPPAPKGPPSPAPLRSLCRQQPAAAPRRLHACSRVRRRRRRPRRVPPPRPAARQRPQVLGWRLRRHSHASAPCGRVSTCMGPLARARRCCWTSSLPGHGRRDSECCGSTSTSSCWACTSRSMRSRRSGLSRSLRIPWRTRSTCSASMSSRSQTSRTQQSCPGSLRFSSFVAWSWS
mmetsp:Transcript_52908/g.169457  ORF Transcript_52908/g.169457 Transcript_52908/m.169457 type:complete len:280 (+) Transcript_52908:161-1000(+)